MDIVSKELTRSLPVTQYSVIAEPVTYIIMHLVMLQKNVEMVNI